jgi:hypothetical protein
VESASWGSAVATVAACGGAGAFIDFWIGKSGQRRVRDWLETWWLRLSYVRWGNLGREESVFAVHIIDRVFGSGLLCLRRVIAVLVMTFMSMCIIPIVVVLYHAAMPWQYLLTIYNLAWFVFIVFYVSVSFSVTRFAATLLVYIITRFHI